MFGQNVTQEHTNQIVKIFKTHAARAAKPNAREDAWSTQYRKAGDAAHRYCQKHGLSTLGDHMVAGTRAFQLAEAAF